MIAFDINLQVIKSEGTAYFRLDDGFYNHLKKVEEKYHIIGFEWNGDRNFGVIVKKKKEADSEHRETEGNS